MVSPAPLLQPLQTAQKPSQIVITIHEAIDGLTIGEFVEQNMAGFRPTSLLAKPAWVPECRYQTVKDMPIVYFIEHCRSYHVSNIPACGINFAVQLSKALGRFKVIWG